MLQFNQTRLKGHKTAGYDNNLKLALGDNTVFE